MNDFRILLVVSLLWILSLALVGLLNWIWNRSLLNQVQNLNNLLSISQKREIDLLNRLMSSDLPTYSMTTGMTSALTTSSPTFSEPIPRDDASEAERMVAMGGFGQTLYEEDVAGFESDLEELGIYVNPDR